MFDIVTLYAIAFNIYFMTHNWWQSERMDAFYHAFYYVSIVTHKVHIESSQAASMFLDTLMGHNCWRLF